jgi:hypothetical protein
MAQLILSFKPAGYLFLLGWSPPLSASTLSWLKGLKSPAVDVVSQILKPKLPAASFLIAIEWAAAQMKQVADGLFGKTRFLGCCA